MSAARNRFFIWRVESETPIEFEPDAWRANDERTDVRYFCGLLGEVNRLLPDQGITFLITWHLDAFDERFRDAVVVLVGDEKHQIPRYAPAVRAIFKTGGTEPNRIGATLGLAPALAWRVALRELRNRAIAVPRRLAIRGAAPAFEMPMGYFALADAPYIPFEDRVTDVFFAGSVESENGFTLRPRLVARQQMVAAVAAAGRSNPHLRIDVTNSGPFANPDQMLDPEAYSGRLMEARIALCPRGNFDETFRLVEAARSGCVAIVETLPERWYHSRTPAIQIGRWASLPSTLETILGDPDALAQRSEGMRRWWTETLSERAVAKYIAASLADSVRK